MDLGRERTATASHSQATDAIRAEIAKAEAEKAEAVEARRQALELLRQDRQEQKREWGEMKKMLESSRGREH